MEHLEQFIALQQFYKFGHIGILQPEREKGKFSPLVLAPIFHQHHQRRFNACVDALEREMISNYVLRELLVLRLRKWEKEQILIFLGSARRQKSFAGNQLGRFKMEEEKLREAPNDDEAL